MDDFEYSVEICDRDWECFFMECEECNLLPPPSAGVDDSGMSDIDDTGSIVAKRIQKVDLMVDYSEADHPIDGPPDCEGPPVEHYLSKHGVSGMESVLSGSEEDIHLQSVNMFFERLKNFTEGETFAEPSQVKAGEAKTEEKQNSDGQQASSSTLPKNIPKLNSLPARGEAAVDKETMRPVDIFSSVNAMKKVKPGFSISPESAASNISAYPQREFFIREQTCTETTVKETTQKNQFNDLLDEVVCSEPTTHTDEAMNMEMRTALTDVKQEDLLTSQFALSKKCSADLPNNLEMVTNVKCKEEQNSNVPQMNATSTNKTATQESSPSASIKRKRRKKRRLSVEPAESGHGYGSHVLVKQETQDSEEELDTWSGGTGLCLSEETNLFYSHEPQKNHHVMSSLYSDSLPVRLSAREINEISHSVPAHGGQYQHLQDSIVRQGRCKATGSGENSTNSCQSVVPLSQTDESVMSVPNNSSNVVTALQPCMKLQVEELHELNKCSRLPLSLTTSVTSKSDQARETALRERKAAPAGSFRQSNKVIHSVIGCENNQNLKFCAAEVKSTSNSILPSAVSDDLAVEVNQNDRVSVAKLVLAVQAGNSGRDNHTLCQRHPEPQQQLEIDCQDIDQYDSSLGSTRLSTSGIISPDTHNTKPQQFKTRASSFLDVISSKVTCAKLASDCINTACDKSCLSNHPSSLYMNDTEVKESQMMAWNPCPPDEINLTGHSQRETKLSMSEDLLISPSEMTLESSCSALDTESVMSLLNENITDMSASFCSSVSQIASGGQGEQKNPILAKHEEGDAPFVPKSQFVSNDSSESRCDLLDLAEDAITASRTEPKIPLDSKHSFTMSSFWSEMEKLTINDILDLRRMNKAVSSSSLPPLQENEQTDSGFFTQLDEPNPKQTNECTSNVPDSAQSSLASVTTFDSSSSGSVMWESEPVPPSLGADIYPEDMLFTSVDDISQPALSGRQISKNISMHNLYALESESFSSTWKGQTLPTLDKGELEKVEYFTDEHATKEDTDSLPSSLTDSYRTTLVDIFQYLFGVKQSVPSHSAPDNITTFSTDGNSVPETYDHFFSEFDTESLFCPLITADQKKDNLVPIFSCSRSANRNLQFPEAYDYFFTSLSSDDSSDEEGDNCGPVRVVTRFSHKANTSQISTDIYENFYTDNDLRQNFFWKGTLSFRNINLTASTIQKQTLSSSQSIVPLRQSKRSLRSTVCPSNVLGNQDVVFSDPLLCCLEDRISRQLAQWPFRCEDLQMAVSTPRLDSSLLPLRQSDMCLVCIAFASWVLKTANPQVGDAWKAVLLANVSALSAIQYLRKYVRTEAAAAEEKLNHSASAS